MMISRAFVVATLVVAGAATAAAGPAPHPMGMAMARGAGFAPWRGGDHRGFHGGWTHRRGDFSGLAIGGIAPTYDAYDAGEAPAPSIWFAPAAPITLTVTTSAAASPSWSEGPRLIVIGRHVPPRHPLPLVVYGDPQA